MQIRIVKVKHGMEPLLIQVAVHLEVEEVSVAHAVDLAAVEVSMALPWALEAHQPAVHQAHSSTLEM
jgi:hypothetical protein